MHLLVDISGHGLGHLAQTGPVIEALAALRPDLRLTVRSAIARERLERRIGVPFTHVAAATDFGFVMHNAVDIDLAASRARYREWHADWPGRVAGEAAWLRSREVDAVLANVAYLPLAAAVAAGIPAFALCSLNWADLFAHYFGDAEWAAPVHAEMRAAYASAEAFLRVEPGLPMAGFANTVGIGPIARPGRRDRERLARALGLDPAARWVLLAMGGMPFPLPVAEWPLRPGWTWLLPDVAGSAPDRPDLCTIDGGTVDFGDLLASADAVVTKPGYGTFVEAACAGVPILYVERDDWPETPHFAAWLAGNARSARVSREQLQSGALTGALEALWRQPAPPLPEATGAGDAARWLAGRLPGAA